MEVKNHKKILFSTLVFLFMFNIASADITRTFIGETQGGGSATKSIGGLDLTGLDTIICYVYMETNTNSVSSLVFDDGSGGNTETFTQVGTYEQLEASNHEGSAWILTSIDTANERILLTANASDVMSLTCAGFSGVDSADPIEDLDQGHNSTTPYDIQATSIEDGSWHTAWVWNANGGGGVSAEYDNQVGTSAQWYTDSDGGVSNTTTHTITRTLGSGNGGWISFMLNPGTGGGGEEPAEIPQGVVVWWQPLGLELSNATDTELWIGQRNIITPTSTPETHVLNSIALVINPTAEWEGVGTLDCSSVPQPSLVPTTETNLSTPTQASLWIAFSGATGDLINFGDGRVGCVFPHTTGNNFINSTSTSYNLIWKLNDNNFKAGGSDEDEADWTYATWLDADNEDVAGIGLIDLIWALCDTENCQLKPFFNQSVDNSNVITTFPKNNDIIQKPYSVNFRGTYFNPSEDYTFIEYTLYDLTSKKQITTATSTITSEGSFSFTYLLEKDHAYQFQPMLSADGLVSILGDVITFFTSTSTRDNTIIAGGSLINKTPEQKCVNVDGLLGIENAICRAFTFLFIPEPINLSQNYNNFQTNLETKAPFKYFFQVKNSLESFAENAEDENSLDEISIHVPIGNSSSTDFVIADISSVESGSASSTLSSLKSFIGMGMYATFAFWAFHAIAVLF